VAEALAQSCERLALKKSWSPLRAPFDPGPTMSHRSIQTLGGTEMQ
jgi:hypothetical protein